MENYKNIKISGMPLVIFVLCSLIAILNDILFNKYRGILTNKIRNIYGFSYVISGIQEGWYDSGIWSIVYEGLSSNLPKIK